MREESMSDSEVERIKQQIFDVHERCKGHPVKSIGGTWKTLRLLKELFWASFRADPVWKGQHE
jgi:hypothetical protein